MMQQWSEWLSAISDNAKQEAIARQLGVSRSTVSRWQKRPDANAVVAIATAYRADPIAGLMVAGIVQPPTLNNEGWRYWIEQMPTPVLVEELCVRLVPKKH